MTSKCPRFIVAGHTDSQMILGSTLIGYRLKTVANYRCISSTVRCPQTGQKVLPTVGGEQAHSDYILVTN